MTRYKKVVYGTGASIEKENVDGFLRAAVGLGVITEKQRVETPTSALMQAMVYANRPELSKFIGPVDERMDKALSEAMHDGPFQGDGV